MKLIKVFDTWVNPDWIIWVMPYSQQEGSTQLITLDTALRYEGNSGESAGILFEDKIPDEVAEEINRQLEGHKERPHDEVYAAKQLEGE